MVFKGFSEACSCFNASFLKEFLLQLYMRLQIVQIYHRFQITSFIRVSKAHLNMTFKNHIYIQINGEGQDVSVYSFADNLSQRLICLRIIVAAYH